MNATQKTNWFGAQSFACVPESVLLDSRLGLRHLRLLCLLILHADKHGIAYPGQDRLAEMMGDYNQPGTPEQTPNTNVISKLISWRNPNTGPGLGLVQLGYVKKLGWIAGRSTQTYQIVIPTLRPEELNRPTSRKLPDVEYAELREQKRQRLMEAFAAREKVKAAKQSAEDTFVWEGEKYTRNELRNVMLAGGLDTYPRPVVVHFGYEQYLV